MIEDLNNDHLRNFEKLRKSVPKEYQPLIDQADYFDQAKLQYLRKKILDLGNESIRTTENSLENFTISFKKDFNFISIQLGCNINQISRIKTNF